MPAPVESSLSAAAAASVALAQIIGDAARRTPAPPEARRACLRVCATVSRTLGPRVGSPSDVGSVAVALIRALQKFARDADQAAVARNFAAAAQDVRSVIASPSSGVLQKRHGMARALAAGLEAAFVGAAIVAEGRAAGDDRDAAAAARRRISKIVDATAARVAAELGDESAEILMRAARTIQKHIADGAASLAPVVRITTPRFFPSTAMAWRLYGDPKRAAKLLSRAGCGTPLFMPLDFEAESPVKP